VHDGTKLYHSTVKTLGEVFSDIDLFPSGQGEVIALGMNAPIDKETLAQRAATLQERYKFRFPLPDQLARRMENPRAQAVGGELLTDDFAPVNLYDTMGDERQRKK
jgi:hypothetical protein